MNTFFIRIFLLSVFVLCLTQAAPMTSDLTAPALRAKRQWKWESDGKGNMWIGDDNAKLSLFSGFGMPGK
ncbi:unnamed protein product, partial [Mesorhabditis belari]|uniref:Uncharacterized protein n=1 Tax=Mesorhabditis belari TaxID=2138241 RepID=A0AAF3EFY4_9BILA